MKRKKWIFFNRFRLVYKRSSPLTKCVVLVAIVLSALALIAIRSGIRRNRLEQQLLQEQAAQLEYENYHLARNIAQIGSAESIKRIAELELGMVDQDSDMFEIETGN